MFWWIILFCSMNNLNMLEALMIQEEHFSSKDCQIICWKVWKRHKYTNKQIFCTFTNPIDIKTSSIINMHIAKHKVGLGFPASLRQLHEFEYRTKHAILYSTGRCTSSIDSETIRTLLSFFPLKKHWILYIMYSKNRCKGCPNP